MTNILDISCQLNGDFIDGASDDPRYRAPHAPFHRRFEVLNRGLSPCLGRATRLDLLCVDGAWIVDREA